MREFFWDLGANFDNITFRYEVDGDNKIESVTKSIFQNFTFHILLQDGYSLKSVFVL